MAVVTTNLGVVTAYGDAVAAGYTGTKAEWQALMASYASVAEEAAQSAEDAETDALKSEGYAVGKQNGTDVTSGSPYYHNNTAYYATQAQTAQTDAETAESHAQGYATAASTSASAAASHTADVYDATATYAVGDYCVYNSQLYKCVTAITTAEEWTAAHWTAVNVMDEVSELNTHLSKLGLSAVDGKLCITYEEVSA